MNGRRQFLQHSSLLGAGMLLAAPASKAAETTNSRHPAASLGGAPATERALHLSNRLGYGPRPGEIDHILRIGESTYIEQQLHPQSILLPIALGAELDALLTLRMPMSDTVSEYQANIAALNGQERRPFIREVAFDVSRNRLLRAIDSPRQLEEVMVEFWYNHFNVFIGKGLDRVLTGHYEQQAIRPHVFGRFRDLLGATAKHPAMLFYLDNAQSVADGFVPRRPAAALQTNRGQLNPDQPITAAPAAIAAIPRGLNENYARELMELHTLGVNAGYSQKDVTELARILTGWTFDRRDTTGNAFRFDDRRHDQGPKVLLGHRVEPAGIAEGESALDMLAAHPSTARHIAQKLAQYFVADQVPTSLVDHLANRFSQTGGDIRAVLGDLFRSEEFWTSNQTKFKTPYQFVVSSVRATGLSLPRNVIPLVGTLNQMGMPLHGCPTPDGYKNTEAAWLNPEAMTRRLNFASALADGKLPFDRPVDASTMPPLMNQQAMNRSMQGNGKPNMPALNWNELSNTLGPTLKPSTRTIIEGSPPELRASLVLGSPEFMRK